MGGDQLPLQNGDDVPIEVQLDGSTTGERTYRVEAGQTMTIDLKVREGDFFALLGARYRTGALTLTAENGVGINGTLRHDLPQSDVWTFAFGAAYQLPRVRVLVDVEDYRRMREEAPVYYNADQDFYALSRHEDVAAAYRPRRQRAGPDGAGSRSTRGGASGSSAGPGTRID